MDFSKLDVEKLLQKNSTKHHYIPQFLLNGFTNGEGLLYVYDKQQDKILKKPRPPGSVFFEKDRNTIDLNDDRRTSIMEDFLYSRIDNDTSKLINSYQNDELSTNMFTAENAGRFLLFLIVLFWRIPYTDYTVDDLMKNSVINSSGVDLEILRNDPTFQKLQRGGLFKHTVDEIVNSGRKGLRSYKIHDVRKDINVISDNPILFRKIPTQFSEFDAGDLMIAISSRRIYSETNGKLTLRINEHLRYNALMVHQATRYVACNDLKVLEASIDFAKNLNVENVRVMTEMVFKNNS